MAGRVIFNPNAFKNKEIEGKVVGFSFETKAQYYRGITLSIVRDIKVTIDGEEVKREDVRFGVNGETFTLEEMRTVIDSDYRWEFGEYAEVSVMKDGGLSKGKHHLKVLQVIAPSYMPFQIESTNEADFEI
ncbi:MAG: DUF6379 domain-containing protein [Lachnospiraceae bacterium]|nr:DUF6379 domain-containing protein [Lachnospiraceae bacterium]